MLESECVSTRVCVSVRVCTSLRACVCASEREGERKRERAEASRTMESDVLAKSE